MKKANEPTMFRQGDVLIRKINGPVKTGRIFVRDEQGRIILAEGEVTGHAHAIHDPGVIAHMFVNGMYLEVQEEAQVVHEEHDPITLPQGHYEVIRQKEFTEEESRYVAD